MVGVLFEDEDTFFDVLQKVLRFVAELVEKVSIIDGAEGHGGFVAEGGGWRGRSWFRWGCGCSGRWVWLGGFLCGCGGSGAFPFGGLFLFPLEENIFEAAVPFDDGLDGGVGPAAGGFDLFEEVESFLEGSDEGLGRARGRGDAGFFDEGTERFDACFGVGLEQREFCGDPLKISGNPLGLVFGVGAHDLGVSAAGRDGDTKGVPPKRQAIKSLHGTRAAAIGRAAA